MLIGRQECLPLRDRNVCPLGRNVRPTCQRTLFNAYKTGKGDGSATVLAGIAVTAVLSESERLVVIEVRKSNVYVDLRVGEDRGNWGRQLMYVKLGNRC